MLDAAASETSEETQAPKPDRVPMLPFYDRVGHWIAGRGDRSSVGLDDRWVEPRSEEIGVSNTVVTGNSINRTDWQQNGGDVYQDAESRKIVITGCCEASGSPDRQVDNLGDTARAGRCAARASTLGATPCKVQDRWELIGSPTRHSCPRSQSRP